MYIKSRVDLGFLWMMLNRFGANPPSLDSVLSYKLEGLDDMLPLSMKTLNVNIAIVHSLTLYSNRVMEMVIRFTG